MLNIVTNGKIAIFNNIYTWICACAQHARSHATSTAHSTAENQCVSEKRNHLDKEGDMSY